MLFLNKMLIVKCPLCKKGQLYKKYLQVVDTCSVCGKDLSKANVGDGASWIVIMIVGAIVTGSALKIEQYYAPPYMTHIFIWIPLTFILTLVLLPILKAFLISQYFRKEHNELYEDK